MRSICLLVMIVLPGLASAQTEYFPLHSDAQWTYGGSPMEIARTMTLSAGADSAGTHAWSGPFGDQRVHLTEDGELYEVIDSGRRLLLDFGASEGTSWTIDATSDDLVSGSRVTVSARNQTKIVSFGTFEAVIHFEVIPPDGLRDAGLTDLWFAPKVGLIGYEEITVAGPQIYELAAFAIPGDDVVTLPTPQPVDPGNLFPASIGLTWTYVGPFDDERQIRILEVTTTGDDTALVLSGLMGDRTIRSTGNRIEQFSSEAWRLLFDLGALEDEFWTLDLESIGEDFLDGARVEVLEREARLEVPYAHFDGVLHLGLSPPPGLADAGLTDLWFAPGVGIIAFAEQSISGPRTYSLVSFANRFEPTPFPEPFPVPDPKPPIGAFTHRNEVIQDGVLFSVGATSDRVTAGEALYLDYMVIGVEGEHTFHFNSTQQVDFWLTDNSGRVVWVWSELLGFGDALTSFSIAAGDTNRSVEMLGRRVAALPEGTYTLTGFLPVSDEAQRLSSEVSIQITIEGDPEAADVDGFVRDRSGEPISEAVVSIHRVGLEEIPGIAVPAIASFTDRDGRFRVGHIRAGTYQLTASKRGYSSTSEVVEIVPGRNTIDIVMAETDSSGFSNAHTVFNDRLLVEVATERAQYAVGDTMRVRYRASNITERSLAMRFPSGQDFDVSVSGNRGTIWTWSESRSFIQALRDTTLAVDESYTFEVTQVIPPSWSEHGGLVLEAFLAVFNLEEEGGLSRGLTRGYVKFALGEVSRPHLDPSGRTQVTLDTDRSLYASSDSVSVQYVLKNVSDDSLKFVFPSGQRYDLALVNGRSGEPQWTWSMNKLFDLSEHTELLAPDSAYTFSETLGLSSISLSDEGVLVLQAHLAVSDQGSDLLVADTRAAQRLWIGDRPPAEEPGLPASRVTRALDVEVSSDSMVARYVIKNEGGKDIPAVYASGQTFEILLENDSGTVWTWSDGFGFTAAIREEVLAAGDSIVVEETIPLPSGQGSFEMVAYLTVNDGPGGNLIPEETMVRQRLLIGSGETVSGDQAARRSDFDGSGSVDFGDFISFAVSFGTRSGDLAFESAFDLDDDGQVGFSDFLTFASAFGATISSH